MQTRNRMTALLIVALTGSLAAVAAGQDNSAKSQPAQPKLSQTRTASCLVRITVDPAIVPLDPATLQGLLGSSAVAGAAVREALHLDSWDNPWETLIETEWLTQSTASASTEQAEGYDAEMMRQLQKIYGGDYLRQIGGEDSATREKPNKPSIRTSPYAAQSRPSSGPGQSVTIRLSVHLPDGVPPAADEFLRAVISNLRSSLSHAYELYTVDLSDELGLAQGQYDHAVEMLQGGTDPATEKIRWQLDKTVDLSSLNPQMPLAEAVETLRKSVEPPLNIVVLWTDLMDNLAVEPTTPIHIGGMANVKLGTALDLLVRGMPSVNAKPMWRVKDDAIVIATAASLGGSDESAGQPKPEVDVRALTAQKNESASKLRELELTLAGQEARRKAIADQIARTEVEANARLSDDEVTKELESLVELSAENLSNLRKQADAGRVSLAELGQATESLTRARIELAKRREELGKQAGGGQLEQLNGELGRMAIEGAEKEAQKGILTERLAQMQQELARASTFDPEAAQRRMSREEIDILARRIGELRVRAANLQSPMVTVIGAD
jgi:hypothetical protein